MGELQKMFESTFDQNLRNEVLLRVIKAKLNEMGITLTHSQVDTIRKRIMGNKIKNFKLSIDDEVLIGSNIPKQALSTKKLSLDVSDVDNLEETAKNVAQQLLSDLPKLISELTDQYVDALKRDLDRKIKPLRKQRHAFESRLYEKWKEPLDSLEYFLTLAMDLGSEFNQDFRPIAAERKDHVFEALTRLHARSSQVGFEILTLLKSGFADGAHARWRTLHEIAVVALFLSEYGEDVANRYLCYEFVDSYRAAKLYQKNCVRLGYEPLSEAEMLNFDKMYQQAQKQFGRSFCKANGWAAAIINKDRITFGDIEEKVAMQHMRSYYKLASNNVHANPKGVFYRLGLSHLNKEILLAGPSNTGLADPANGTALSICQITTSLLLHETNLDRLVASKALFRLSDHIQKVFTETQLDIEKSPAHISME
jgi:hypothetical protein